MALVPVLFQDPKNQDALPSRAVNQLLGVVRHRQVFGRVVKTTEGTGV